MRVGKQSYATCGNRWVGCAPRKWIYAYEVVSSLITSFGCEVAPRTRVRYPKPSGMPRAPVRLNRVGAVAQNGASPLRTRPAH